MSNAKRITADPPQTQEVDFEESQLSDHEKDQKKARTGAYASSYKPGRRTTIHIPAAFFYYAQHRDGRVQTCIDEWDCLTQQDRHYYWEQSVNFVPRTLLMFPSRPGWILTDE